MDESSLAWLVLAAPLSLLAVAALALGAGRDRAPVMRQAGTAATWFGVAVALAAGFAVVVGGATSSPLLGVDGLGASVRLDALSTIMFAMIGLLAVVIYRYSVTYLDGDERQVVFLGRLAATVAAVEVLVLAGNLALLLAAWVATSLALHGLLLFYSQRRAARVAGRKKFVVARIGDVFLAASFVLLYRTFGTGDLQAIFDGAVARSADTWAFGSVEVAAVGIAVAAMLKSAQFPTHGWLVEVMETPTPVSALLHAGILNAGPFLVIRMALVVDGADVATALLIAVGGFTALFASLVLLTQPTVKVALGYSSAAHMGFMLLICGIGVFPAALLHLVAHSFYKAHAFLSSGSVVDEARAAPVALPQRLGRPIRIVGSFAVAAVLYLALASVVGIGVLRDPLLLAVGAILVLGTAQIVAPAMDSSGPVAAVVRAVLMALGVTVAFFALEEGAHVLLAGAVPEEVTRTALHLVLIGMVLVAFTVAVVFQILEPARGPSTRRRHLAMHLRNGLYANAAFDRVVGALRMRHQPPLARTGLVPATQEDQ
jgi:NAD(P)H-quinone oxidoreductase subunit 5